MLFTEFLFRFLCDAFFLRGIGTQLSLTGILAKVNMTIDFESRPFISWPNLTGNIHQYNFLPLNPGSHTFRLENVGSELKLESFEVAQDSENLNMSLMGGQPGNGGKSDCTELIPHFQFSCCVHDAIIYRQC